VTERKNKKKKKKNRPRRRKNELEPTFHGVDQNKLVAKMRTYSLRVGALCVTHETRLELYGITCAAHDDTLRILLHNLAGCIELIGHGKRHMKKQTTYDITLSKPF